MLDRRALGALAAAILAGVGLMASASAAFELHGHRGARGLAPENTLEGFGLALAIGVDALEFDLGLTGDHVVVVYHDTRLNPDITKGPDGAFLESPGPLLRALDFAELRRYEVGGIRPGRAYALRFAEQRPAPGARIPSLAEVAGLVKESGVRLNLEIKISSRAPEETAPRTVFVQAVVDALRAHGLAARSTIQSFDWRTLQEVQRLAPDIPTAYLTLERGEEDRIERGGPGASPWTAPFDIDDYAGSVPRMVKAAGGAVWSPFYADLSRAEVEEAHALGLRVIVWTVNAPEAMRTFIRLGVDGLITDRPDILRAVMAEEGLPLPAPVEIGARALPD